MRQASGLLIATAALAGCALPAHNNTLIFATKTDVGLGVSTPSATDAGVSVTLGYKERRAAWVPLWANKGIGNDKQAMDCVEVYTGTAPSAARSASEVQAVGTAAHVSCKKGPKFVADDDAGGGRGDNARNDAYSTFASFGGDFGGSGGSGSSGPQAQASGRIASFFATGVAAQYLAANPASVGLPQADKPVDGADADKKKAAEEAAKDDPAKAVGDFVALSAIRENGQPDKVRAACVKRLAAPLAIKPGATDKVTGITASAVKDWITSFKEKQPALTDELPVLSYSARELSAQWKKARDAADTSSAAEVGKAVCGG